MKTPTNLPPETKAVTTTEVEPVPTLPLGATTIQNHFSLFYYFFLFFGFHYMWLYCIYIFFLKVISCLSLNKKDTVLYVIAWDLFFFFPVNIRSVRFIHIVVSLV